MDVSTLDDRIFNKWWNVAMPKAKACMNYVTMGIRIGVSFMNELMETNLSSRIQADVVYVCKNYDSASSFVYTPFVVLYRWPLNSAVW